MKAKLLVCGAVLAFALITAYVVAGGAAESEVSAGPDDGGPRVIEQRERERAANFSLVDLDGVSVSLDDYKGKKVYVNFWATWCKWCKAEMPDMERIHQQFADKDVVVLAVSVGEDRDKAGPYIEEHGYTFKVLLDVDKSVTRAYKVSRIPTSLFVDEDGGIAYQQVGPMTEAQMQAVIRGM